MIDDDWRQRVELHFSALVPVEPPSKNSILSGIVVANAPKGIYLDVGHGVPAFLEIIYVGENDNSTTPNWTKAHGTKLAVMTSHATDDEISVHQSDYENWAPEFDGQNDG